MAIKQILRPMNFIGLSSDTKPVPPPGCEGSTFFEYDTKNTYICYDGTSWSLAKSEGMAKATTFNLQQAANTYDLFTAMAQNLVISSFVIRLPNVNVADDATITSISVQTDDATAQVLISAATGAKANLTAEKQLSWTGAIILAATKKIRLTIAGGAADASTLCSIATQYTPTILGGYLA